MKMNDELQLLVAESVQEYLKKEFILEDIEFLREYVTLCWEIIG